ncbi:hypothetical protein FS749_003209 [Ceratobasidium sp. UAMH 11750]|nr:hypothetical protein FS749_003209 [Ceratobasidium sp. UAMH 11750]
MAWEHMLRRATELARPMSEVRTDASEEQASGTQGTKYGSLGTPEGGPGRWDRDGGDKKQEPGTASSLVAQVRTSELPRMNRGKEPFWVCLVSRLRSDRLVTSPGWAVHAVGDAQPGESQRLCSERRRDPRCDSWNRVCNALRGRIVLPTEKRVYVFFSASAGTIPSGA